MFGWFRCRFKPRVCYFDDDKITEMVLKDCFTVWHPLQSNAGHFVDLGYDQEGDLIGIRIWADVREPPGPTRGIYEGAALLEKLHEQKPVREK